MGTNLQNGQQMYFYSFIYPVLMMFCTFSLIWSSFLQDNHADIKRSFIPRLLNAALGCFSHHWVTKTLAKQSVNLGQPERIRLNNPPHLSRIALLTINWQLGAASQNMICASLPPVLKVISHLQFDVSAAAPLENEIIALLLLLVWPRLSSSTLPRTYCSVLLWW